MGAIQLEFAGGFPYLVVAYLVCYGLIGGYAALLLVRRRALRGSERALGRAER